MKCPHLGSRLRDWTPSNVAAFLCAAAPVSSTPESVRDPVITARALARNADPQHAFLAGFNLSVQAGEVWCLVGEPGSGAATALYVLAGLLRADSGTCTVDGVDPAVDPLGARRVVTLATRKAALYRNMTGRQNVLFFARVAATPAPSRVEIDNAMRRAGVPERAFDRLVRDVPRHIRLKLWLALAWLRDTPVVLLEDPTHAVDSAAASGIIDAIHDLRAGGKAVLISTPDMFFAGHTADRVWIMAEGRQVEERPGPELLASRLNELYLVYAGRSGILPARIDRRT